MLRSRRHKGTSLPFGANFLVISSLTFKAFFDGLVHCLVIQVVPLKRLRLYETYSVPFKGTVVKFLGLLAIVIGILERLSARVPINWLRLLCLTIATVNDFVLFD